MVQSRLFNVSDPGFTHHSMHIGFSRIRRKRTRWRTECDMKDPIGVGSTIKQLSTILISSPKETFTMINIIDTGLKTEN